MIELKKFVLAGKAGFNLTLPSGKHYTYRVNKAKENPNFPGESWFVNVGISYEDSIYVGILKGETPTFGLTKNSKASIDSPSVQTFNIWWAEVLAGVEEPVSAKFSHLGRCCVCYRELTNPESVEAGIGPECSGKE